MGSVWSQWVDVMGRGIKKVEHYCSSGYGVRSTDHWATYSPEIVAELAV